MKHANEELDNNRDNITPHDFDVLSGQRGRGFDKHRGNCRYKELIDSNLSRYDETVLNDRKRLIVYDIITEINQNGRFLKRSKSTMRWCIQNREETRVKVTTALQDKIRNVRRACEGNEELLGPPESVIQQDPHNAIVNQQNMGRRVGSGSRDLENQTSTFHHIEAASANQLESSTQVLLPRPYGMTVHLQYISRPFGSSCQSSKFHHGDNAVVEAEEKETTYPRKEQTLSTAATQLDPDNTIIQPQTTGLFPPDSWYRDDTHSNVHQGDVMNTEPLRRSCDQSMCRMQGEPLRRSCDQSICQMQGESTGYNADMFFDKVIRDVSVKESMCDLNMSFQFTLASRQTDAVCHQESETIVDGGNDWDYLDLLVDETFI